MDITVTTFDLDGDGTVSLWVPRNYYLDWGQALPATLPARTVIMPGTLEWTNYTTYLGNDGNAATPDYSVEWYATFTPDYLYDPSGDFGASFGPVYVAGSGQYLSSSDPGDAIVPFEPWADFNSYFRGVSVEVIGSDADELFAASSGPSWMDFFSSQLVHGGGGNDFFRALTNGTSVLYGEDGNDFVSSMQSGHVEFYGGNGIDHAEIKVGDVADGGGGNDFLKLNTYYTPASLDISVDATGELQFVADGVLLDIHDFEGFDVFANATNKDFSLDLRGYTHGFMTPSFDFTNPTLSIPSTSFSFYTTGHTSFFADAATVGKATTSGFNDVYLDFTGSSVEALFNATTIRHGGLNISYQGNVKTLDATGGSGNDNFYLANNMTATLRGGAGKDWLGVNIASYTGTHIFNGGSDDDTLVGGSGTDTAEFSGSYYDYVIDLVNGKISGPDGTDTFSRIEFFRFADGTYTLATQTFDGQPPNPFSGVLVEGTAGDDVIDGGHAPSGQPRPKALDDMIYGRGGNDTVNGGIGADTAYGGSGNDIYYVDNVGDVVSEANEITGLDDGGEDLVRSRIDYTLGDFVENLVLAGPSALNGTGNDLNNMIYGNAEDNVLMGNGGNDTLDGRTGADAAYGGSGNDIYYVDNAGDVVSEANKITGLDDGGEDLVRSRIDFALSDFVENLALIGLGPLNGTGNDLNNKIYGNVGDNVLTGNGGNDAINGGIGADTAYGGSGNDIYYVDNAGDIASEANAITGLDDGGEDLVRSYIDFTLGDFVENLFLIGSGPLNGTGNDLDNKVYGNAEDNVLAGNGGNDTMQGKGGNDTLLGGDDDDVLFGGDGNDHLDGGADNDVLKGGGGDDVLIGGGGIDQLVGGAGADEFHLGREGNSKADTITDFETGVDHLVFSAAALGLSIGNGVTAAGALEADYFFLGKPATAGHAVFFYNATNHTLYFDADGVSGGSEAVARLQLDAEVSATDFLLI